MRKILVLFSAFSLLFFSCEKSVQPKMTIDAQSAKKSYGKLTISPEDSVSFSAGVVKISPHDENTEYTISGYFDGQIIVMTKNTTIKLDNAYLENTSGKSALKCEKKAEISAAKGSANYIVSRGRGFARNAAILCEEGLVLGGSGTLYAKGSICHGVEAKNMKIKGSGTFYIEGTNRGSAIKCESLSVDNDKTFRCYLLNSKNGVKADETISIASGFFFAYGNKTAFKTGTSSDSPKKKHSIVFSGGKFSVWGNKSLFETEKGAFNDFGATIIEENE